VRKRKKGFQIYLVLGLKRRSEKWAGGPFTRRKEKKKVWDPLLSSNTSEFGKNYAGGEGPTGSKNGGESRKDLSLLTLKKAKKR